MITQVLDLKDENGQEIGGDEEFEDEEEEESYDEEDNFIDKEEGARPEKKVSNGHAGLHLEDGEEEDDGEFLESAEGDEENEESQE